MYGPTSYDISAEYFYSDLFCYCFNLTPNPLLTGDKGITLEPQDRTLSFVEGAVLDVNLAFSESLSENTMVFFVGYFDTKLQIQQVVSKGTDGVFPGSSLGDFFTFNSGMHRELKGVSQ